MIYLLVILLPLLRLKVVLVKKCPLDCLLQKGFAFTDGTAEEYGVDVYDWKSSSLGAAKYAANNKKRLQEKFPKRKFLVRIYI